VPAFAILVEVEIFAPLNQVVDFVVKVFVAHFRVLLIVERVFVERLKLLLETLRLHSSLIYGITLLCNQLCILSISVQFSEPSNLTVPSILSSLFLAQLGLEVELLGLLRRLQLDLVTRSQYFVRDGPPAVALNSMVPAIVAVVLRLVEADVDRVFFVMLLQRVVVSRCEGVDVYDSSVSEDFVINQRWESITT